MERKTVAVCGTLRKMEEKGSLAKQKAGMSKVLLESNLFFLKQTGLVQDGGK